MKQYGKIEDMDRTFDVTFWQAQSPTARLNAAWELVEFYARLKGHTDELRLQRSVETFQRQHLQDVRTLELPVKTPEEYQ